MAVRQLPAVSVGSLAFRAAVPVGAALVLLAGDRVVALPAIVLVAGVVGALVRPARIGAWAAIPAAAWSFLVSTPDDVGLVPVLLAAAGVYLIHTGTAAAAACPLGARVSRDVGLRWLGRCLPAVLITAVVLAVDAVLGRTPDNPLFITVAGLLVVVAVVSLVRLLAATRDDAAPGR